MAIADSQLCYGRSKAIRGVTQRRVDGRADASARHRWTDTIAGRVFYEPIPRLLNDVSSQFDDRDDPGNAAALRISLLWDELLEKLDRSPTAILGLLDIANTRLSREGSAISQLKAALSAAPKRAIAELSPADAWSFIDALARKLSSGHFPEQIPAVLNVAVDLAKQDALSAIEYVDGSRFPHLHFRLVELEGSTLTSCSHQRM